MQRQLAGGLSVVWCCCVALPGAVAAQATRSFDSAGIHVVANGPVVSAGVRFRLAATPVAVIGGIRDDPADELNERVSYPSAVRLSTDRVLVPNGTDLRIYSNAGKLIRTMGRAGAGPGEFRELQGACLFGGDSILVWDVGNRRVSVWTPDGRLAREYPSGGAFVHGGSCLANGSVVADGPHVPSDRDDVPLTDYLILSPTGVASAHLGALPATMYGGIMREAKVAIRAGRVYFGDEITFGARVFDRAGHQIGIIRTDDRLLPVTDASLNAHPMMCTPDRRTGECTPVPTRATTWPAYYDMHVDGAGRLWEKLNAGDDSAWVAFDSTGRLIGTLVLPPPAKDAHPRVVGFGNDEVVIADLDPDGARRIRFFRLLPVD